MPATVIWNPAMLNQALLSAYRPSVYQARDYAKANSPSSKAGATAKRINAASISTARADLVPTIAYGDKAYVGGNIVDPLINYVDKMQADDVSILEISSFQLDQMTVRQTSPRY